MLKKLPQDVPLPAKALNGCIIMYIHHENLISFFSLTLCSSAYTDEGGYYNPRQRTSYKASALDFSQYVMICATFPGILRIFILLPQILLNPLPGRQLSCWQGLCRLLFSLGSLALYFEMELIQQIHGVLTQGGIQQISLGGRGYPQLLQLPTVEPWGACWGRGGGVGMWKEIPLNSAWGHALVWWWMNPAEDE